MYKNEKLLQTTTKKSDILVFEFKGVPASYGGFGIFVEKLTQYKIRDDIYYHISCLLNNNDFEHNKARYFNVKVFNLQAAKLFIMMYQHLQNAFIILKNQIKESIVYILACRIASFIRGLKRKLHRLGDRLYVNTDDMSGKR